MKQKQKIIIPIIFFMLLIWGINPFAPYRDTTLVLAETDVYSAMESGVHRQGNGIYLVN